MSRVGKKPVEIPAGVQVDVGEVEIKIKGKTSQLTVRSHRDVVVTKEGDKLLVKPRVATQQARAAWGLVRNLLANAMLGSSAGFKKTLEINGVGYRASVEGNILSLDLGFSHPIKYAFSSDVQVVCSKPTTIEIAGTDKQKVGQIASEIRAFRKPEPYKGKGIKYDNERINRKVGKKK